MKVVGVSKEYDNILKETNSDFWCAHGVEMYTLSRNTDNKKIGLKFNSIEFSGYGGSRCTVILLYLGNH